MAGTLSGRLVVATPALTDPNFARTVVLVVEHTDEGAVGLVLNRPSITSVADALDIWAPVAAQPAVVFVGGPVQPTAAIGLGVAAPGSAAGVIDLAAPLEGLVAARIFAGYAGWGAGQLEWEIGLDSWFVLDAEPSDVLAAAPERLWHDVLWRQHGRLAWFANYPEDPTLN